MAFVVYHANGVENRTKASDYRRLYSVDKEVLQQSLEYIQRVSNAILSLIDQDLPPAVV